MISLDKKYRTRNGHGVKLQTVTAEPPHPVRGVMFLDHYECDMKWQSDGTYGPIPQCPEDYEIIDSFSFSDYDLIEIPPSTDG